MLIGKLDRTRLTLVLVERAVSHQTQVPVQGARGRALEAEYAFAVRR